MDAELQSRGQSSNEGTERYLNNFLEAVFDISRPNLRINGRTLEEAAQDDDIEPFDEALDRHIWSLSDQRLKWDKEIAERRRIRPREIEEFVSNSLAQHSSAKLDVLQADTLYEIPAKEIDPEARQTFSHMTALLSQLSQSISVHSDRATKINTVLAEVKTHKPLKP